MSTSASRLASLLSLALLSAACKDEPATPTSADAGASAQQPQPPPEPPPARATPGVGEDGDITFAVDWFEGNLEQAIAAAKREDKLIFVDVGAYWCPPCHELDETVFTVPAVGDWLREHAIALHIDAEKGEGPELVERYQVQAYPTMLVLESSGVEKSRLVDAHAPEALIAKLEAAAAGGNVLEDLERAVETADPDQPQDRLLELRYRLGHAYLLAAKRAQADSIFDALLAADPQNTAGVASRVLYDRALFSTLKLDADPARAITELEALQARFPDSRQARSAYRIIGRAHCQLEQPDQAVAALAAMVATDPEDPELKASFGWFAFRHDCRPDAGLEAVLAGIEQDPDSAELRYLEAELRRLLDQPAAALEAIRAASRLEPESAYYKRQVRRFEALTKAGAPRQ
ncbi:thioredoxin family protein [Pseudenhygromyxa sp. WMMC2535]|uniref:thioredoxin family protein n=1 Tax=Pseudenhygromyxa sp. WMMC2535 TaxID=2712867 RepID=UPI001556A0F5|nr:thioredoxin family protein [Pseudenhygromyxa sp. WMMC2535]NVB42235.1 thioredoxin family protein [Pseudenhygromyxa sp. WMMC2535]